ncbi:hypothetical protein FACS1894184_20930 [Clostridia bacterium]|nr:hypothetical protein FACS1894184_20930 [Clostridia bacterium]
MEYQDAFTDLSIVSADQNWTSKPAPLMFELSDRLKQLRDVKDDLEQQVKDCGALIKDTQKELSDQMVKAEVANFTRAGSTFYLSTTLRASVAEGEKDMLFAALKKKGHGDLVTLTLNSNTLASFVKEQIEANDNKLPDWLDGLVKFYNLTTVNVR